MEGVIQAPGVAYRIDTVLYDNSVTKRSFYKVKNSDLNMYYGLKVIEITDIKEVKQVKNEITALNRLPFGMAAKCLQYWVKGNQHFLLLDWVEGKPLSDLYQHPAQTPSDIQQRILVAQKLAQKVADIHRHKILHRDIKPENTIVRLRGNNIQDVMLIDFGMSNQNRAVEEGSPYYQAPEQNITRHVRLSECVDIFSLCQTIHFLLSGHPVQLIPNFMNDGWENDIKDCLDSNLPQELVSVLVKGLEFDPRKRTKQATTLANELRNILRKLSTRK